MFHRVALRNADAILFGAKNRFENRFIVHLPKVKQNDHFVKTGSGHTQITESTQKEDTVGVFSVCAGGPSRLIYHR
eukprot:COSAG06_NODE_2256_length_7222_cov_14.605363_8_plen_76_part_00